MGRADGLASPQDPRRLPRLPRSHPLQRKRFTADPMSTGEPDATETGTSGSGRGRRKRSSNPEPPRRRPTSPHGGFGKRSEETGRSKDRNRAPDRLHNNHRPHRTLGQAAPLRPLPQPTTSATNTIRRRDRLGGLLHEYQQVAGPARHFWHPHGGSSGSGRPPRQWVGPTGAAGGRVLWRPV